MNARISAADISEVSIDTVSDDGLMLVNEAHRPRVMVDDIGQHDARI